MLWPLSSCRQSASGFVEIVFVERFECRQCIRLLIEPVAFSCVLRRKYVRVCQYLDRFERPPEVVQRPNVEQIEIEIVREQFAPHSRFREGVFPSARTLEVANQVNSDRSVVAVQLHGATQVGFPILLL